jgi:hypothetical protein
MRLRVLIVFLVALAGQLEAAPVSKPPKATQLTELVRWASAKLNNLRNKNSRDQPSPQARPVEPPPLHPETPWQSHPPPHLSLGDILNEEGGQQLHEEYRNHGYTDKEFVEVFNKFNRLPGTTQETMDNLNQLLEEMGELFRKFGRPR